MLCVAKDTVVAGIPKVHSFIHGLLDRLTTQCIIQIEVNSISIIFVSHFPS